MNVKGMNTAATLWCSAAVGSLAGAGYTLQALLGTAGVLLLHLTLRPLSQWIDRGRKAATDAEAYYRIRVVCETDEERVIRTILMRHVNSRPSLMLQGLSTEDCNRPGNAEVIAQVYSLVRDDRAVEEVISRINIEPSVMSASWEKIR
jgi:putative Mg2+ transporter-C (MgtC) family protein